VKLKEIFLPHPNLGLKGNKKVWHQDSQAPVEKDSSAPKHFGTVEKKCQIGTAFSFKQK
jgi:hypothetical protein